MQDKIPTIACQQYHRYADYLVQKKYLEAEVHKFEKKKKKGEMVSWANFTLREETKCSVRKHLAQQMLCYKDGDVNLKTW